LHHLDAGLELFPSPRDGVNNRLPDRHGLDYRFQVLHHGHRLAVCSKNFIRISQPRLGAAPVILTDGRNHHALIQQKAGKDFSHPLKRIHQANYGHGQKNQDGNDKKNSAQFFLGRLLAGCYQFGGILHEIILQQVRG